VSCENCFLQCSDIVGWAIGRAIGHPACKKTASIVLKVQYLPTVTSKGFSLKLKYKECKTSEELFDVWHEIWLTKVDHVIKLNIGKVSMIRQICRSTLTRRKLQCSHRELLGFVLRKTRRDGLDMLNIEMILTGSNEEDTRLLV